MKKLLSILVLGLLLSGNAYADRSISITWNEPWGYIHEGKRSFWSTDPNGYGTMYMCNSTYRASVIAKTSVKCPKLKRKTIINIVDNWKGTKHIGYFKDKFRHGKGKTIYDDFSGPEIDGKKVKILDGDFLNNKFISGNVHFLDGTKWEEIDRIGNKFNRFAMWDAKTIHAASKYFGTSKETGRLFHMFFFNAE